MDRWMGDVLQMAAIGVVVAGVFSFIIGPYRIGGDSMEPNYSSGDVVMVDKISYRWKSPQAGDAVIIKTPYGVMLKRIIRGTGEGGYWVEGDNKEKSTDSRDYGAVPGSNVIGKAGIKIWGWWR
ncbi:hypothetical protein A2899_04840 [Candidatus Amesbacteria bacterium RIFCSPLOWO2_01_FULL_49_25]|uniref:signal peptidase I n=1 Tax=Candidatus Amesbacteria bacterium RIFCSPHIGHO2_01_FULL_48_32b TaxID=1797253 RepID=A0A1F4YDN2_9BACT|nr:MAG: hypothetical protein A2876_01820 [Candidatus Amesbacteria bacterium RIFCSPHIGHO2_01_FULL_48_32b]OGD07301.1 MAG: hypothetical protein A2899_04840 [Candidatus Amesbacteria bacterium RIFCSPLOWO2_01_FULL_49_25]